MQDDGKRSLLSIGKIAQRVCDGINRLERNLARQIFPTGIAHIIDVTITAIDVAATGDFQENRFQFNTILSYLIQWITKRIIKLTGAIMTVVHSVVRINRIDFFVANFFN